MTQFSRLSAELTGIPAETLRNSEMIGGLLIAAAGAAGFSSLGVPATRTRPDGACDAALLLDQAHLVVHALPERGILVLDLFASVSHDLGKALDVFTRRLHPTKVNVEPRKRG
ncbi:MAG TPA: S-adenosylmethionine decarboxylase [Gemmatimonadaceae bacterium]|nr:S-adenosylmethionine decarboxylase [Gemmatimonadaceae bacterium]